MYSAFIAYHGSNDVNGSFNHAKTVEDLLIKCEPKYRVYCGPDTDEHTFEEHMTKVIPNSKCFILVINDYVPVDEYGYLDEARCEYLIAEIKSFKNMIENDQRNVKDFAVCYAGTKFKDDDLKNARQFVKTLLAKIDPKNVLFNGNQYFVIRTQGAQSWFKSVLGIGNEDEPISFKYAPFGLIEKAFKDSIDSSSHSFMLEMKRGMGKTTFVKHIKNDMFLGRNVAFFFNRDEGYASLGKFKKAFDNQMIGDKDTDVYLEDIGNGNLNRENFAEYVNKLKEELYGDSKFLICLDSIDDAKIINGRSPVLELFSDLSLFNNDIYFLFTARMPENGSKYNDYIEHFIASNNGTKMKVDETNKAYVEYLYRYYCGEVKKTFDNADLNVDEMYESVKPKNILTFSLLFHIFNLYLESGGEKEQLKVVKTIEHALEFYYNFMKTRSGDDEDYLKSMKGLYLLSISSKPLTLEELDALSIECFDEPVSLSFINFKGPLSILVDSYQNGNNQVVYDIRHERLKEIIENDSVNSMNRRYVNHKIKGDFEELKTQKTSFLDFVYANKSAQFLLSHYFRNIDSKEQKVQDFLVILNSITNLSWGDTTEKIVAQQSVLENIVTLPEFEELSDTQKGIILTRLAIDELQIDFNQDAAEHGQKAYDLLVEHENELNDRELYAFMDATAVLGNAGCRMRNDIPVVKMLKKSYEISEVLFNKGIVPLRDYTNNLLSYGNVAANKGGDLDTDEQCLKKAHDILFASTDPTDLGQRGWYYQRLSNFHNNKGMREEAEKDKLLAYEAYLTAFDAEPYCFYFGNLVEVSGSVLAIKAKSMTDKHEIFNLIASTEKEIFSKAESIKFHSARTFVGFYRAAGDLYYKNENIEQAIRCYKKALNEINVIKEKSKQVSRELQEHQEYFEAQLNKISE